MNKHRPNDIAAFPELFDGMDQFLAEEAARLRRTGFALALMVGLPGGLLVLGALAHML